MKKNNPRIGELLVKKGIIDQKTLDAAIENQKRFFFLTLGQILSTLYKVPMIKVDEVHLKKQVMPLFVPALLYRLMRIACKDKFARNLDLKGFVKGVQAKPVSYTISNVDRRRYDSENAKQRVTTEDRRSVVTDVYVETTVDLKNGRKVNGIIRVTHDTSDNKLVIIDDDDQLRSAVYYALRNEYKKKPRIFSETT